RRIPNARHFWFASALLFTAQYFRCSGLRCSPLNAALEHFKRGRSLKYWFGLEASDVIAISAAVIALASVV
ncbi:hypothetical protein, partial [Vibrio parahaemolyticus]|uniref:hypothetical protein n=1 Tax=Vibrio parahaemolyticus TaxID=670 RepID=UPI00235EC2FA